MLGIRGDVSRHMGPLPVRSGRSRVEYRLEADGRETSTRSLSVIRVVKEKMEQSRRGPETSRSGVVSKAIDGG